MADHINLGTKENMGLNSTDAPTMHFPHVHLDGKPAEMVDKEMDGATEFMALVKISVDRREEVSKREEADGFDFEDGPIRLSLALMDMTIVPDTRKGMPAMKARQDQNFTRNPGQRRVQDEQAIDAGLDMIQEGIKQMK